ncbi:MAG: extracellular solute-binding protein [Chloroflexi bacterium]|nr:extracellular solute-binding protein [Chloroflexota bacterium]
MKKNYLACAAIAGSVFLAACAQGGPAPATPPPAPVQAGPVAGSTWDELVRAAKKDGNVTIYGAELGAAKDAIRRAFKDKYGIDVDSTEGRPAEILAKLTAERRAGLFLSDVGLIGNSTYVADIKPLGITVPLSPLFVLPEVGDAGKWRGGRLPFLDREGHSLAMVAMAVPVSIMNTDMVREGEVASFLDYLTPKWKDKIVLSDPAVAGSANNFFTLMVTQTWGMDRTLEVLRQLALQDPVMTRDQRMLLEWVARGKYPVGIGQSAAMFAEFKRLGAPVGYLKLKEPPFISSGSGNIFVFDKAPHPSAAKLFVNWLLSKEGATLWSQAHGYPSQRVDVSKEGFDPLIIPPPEGQIPGEDYLKTQGEMRRVAQDIFAGLRK